MFLRCIRRYHLQQQNHVRRTQQPNFRPFGSSNSQLVPYKKKLTFIESLREKIQTHPFASHLYRQQNRVKHYVDQYYEWYQTSQNPWLYRFDGAVETVSSETDIAKATRIIRDYDPHWIPEVWFDQFVDNVPYLIDAILERDRAYLAQYCTEKCTTPLFAQWNEHMRLGLVDDSRLLHIHNSDIYEISVKNKEPTVVVRLVAQQVHRYRNQKGELIEGSDDDIRAVHYMISSIPVQGTWKINEIGVVGIHGFI